MKNEPLEPYDIIATIYDHWQKSFDRPYYEIVSNLLKKELRASKVKPGAFLDIACGTGDIALFMARRGWRVTGVDSSAGMLEKAARKIKDANADIKLVHERMENLQLDSTYQMAGSFYDCVNHITSKHALRKAFKRIRKHLDADSLFFFDTNTLSCYRNLWDATFVGHEDAYTLILENSFEEAARNAQSKITIFQREKGSSYSKNSVKVVERWYTTDELETILKQAGFEIVRRDPLYLFKIQEDDPYKQWWVCRVV